METKVFNVEMKSGIRRTPEFEKKGLAGFAVNVGLRCGHGCEYCSTGALLRTHSWFQHSSIKKQGITSFTRGIAVVDPAIADRVAEDARRIGSRDHSKRGLVEVCTTTDAWSPEARKHNLGRKILKAILEQPGWTVRVLTKSADVADDFDLICGYRERVLVGISLTATPDQSDVCSAIEPHASLIPERMDAIRQANRQGLRTYGMLCPLLPEIGNSAAQIEKMVKFVVGCGAEELFVEPVNPRGPGLMNTQEALEAGGYGKEAAAVQEIRNTAKWSRYTRQLIADVQRAVRKHFDIRKLRVLLYPSNLTPEDKKAIQRDDKGVVWLGKE
jgi:DNA repair photolyase